MSDQPIIRIRGLDKTYSPGTDREVRALNGIDLTINEGDIFGIIGLSGAGKSTLVRCMNFLEKPTAGTVEVNGQDLASLTPKELRTARRSIGMIFQQFNLLMQRTALGNICFPLEIAGVDKAAAKERAMEMHMYMVEMPQNSRVVIDTVPPFLYTFHIKYIIWLS